MEEQCMEAFDEILIELALIYPKLNISMKYQIDLKDKDSTNVPHDLW